MNPANQPLENATVDPPGTATPRTVPSRRGDVCKCPVCGSAVDSEAYHCPTCRSYFCFHCRARLLEPDTRLQCVNQDCDYYGKLVCGICDPLHEKDEAPSIYAEPEDGYWPAWLILVLISAAALWYYQTSFKTAAIGAIVTYLTGGYLLQRLGLNIFGRHRTLEHPRKSTFHTCIHCKSEVKELHKSA
jgi:hypothetical protein